jgi:aryl-alcohol dehydrogenase-like predicted oxidoreductase
MQRRRPGRTNPEVSVVGFGTCQLRMVTRTWAIDTLPRGFDFGVNLVHTAPDYEGPRTSSPRPPRMPITPPV